MIRLGSLAGYSFKGPRVLGGWTPPAESGVYAILKRPDPEAKPETYAVLYIGESEDLSEEGFPFRHPQAPCWIKRAESKWQLHICTYQFQGGGQAHREEMVRELVAIYEPNCNPDQYDKTWKREWIGDYDANTKSLAPRDANESPTS